MSDDVQKLFFEASRKHGKTSLTFQAQQREIERLSVELDKIKVVREREAQLDNYRCRLIEEQEQRIEELNADVGRLKTILRAAGLPEWVVEGEDHDSDNTK